MHQSEKIKRALSTLHAIEVTIRDSLPAARDYPSTDAALEDLRERVRLVVSIYNANELATTISNTGPV